MSLSWTHRIAKALAGGRPSPALELHLDALLVWLSNPDNPRAAELDRAIARQRLTREAAGASAYRLLDQQLFAGEDPPAPERLGLDPGAPAALAKQRYRRLVQVYHPDRHPERTDWATRRTEQINLAFAALQQGASGTAKAGTRRTQPRSTSRPVTRRSRRLPPDWLPAPLRDLIAPAWLWAHARIHVLSPLQQRMLSTATIVLALLLTVTLWPETPPKPAPRIIHHPLGITPPPPVVAPETEPEPPAPPPAPIRQLAAVTPSAEPAMLAAAPITTRCQNVPEILSRFQSAYRNGALDQLMALYSPLAKENDLATWFAIRQTYAEWFRTTSSRRIDFEQTQVQPIADSRRCALMAVFQVSYLDRQSRLVTQAGIIEMLLEPQGADWLILRARY